MKFYKVITVILALVVIYLTFRLSNQSEKIRSVQMNPFTSFDQIESEEDLAYLLSDFDSLTELLTDTLDTSSNMRVHSKIGKPISKEQAKSKKGDFRAWNKRRRRFKLKPYAFTFGKKRLEKMLEEIEKINKGMGSVKDSLKIQGIRIYFVRSKKKRPRKNLDIMIVPALGTGADYWAPSDKFVISSDTSHLYLNTSSPCPDNCDPPSK